MVEIGKYISHKIYALNRNYDYWVGKKKLYSKIKDIKTTQMRYIYIGFVHQRILISEIKLKRIAYWNGSKIIILIFPFSQFLREWRQKNL